MKRIVLGLSASLFISGTALAAPFIMTYNATVSLNNGVDHVSVGDPVSIRVQVDNGGNSLVSQTWTAADVLSVTFDIGNGTHATTFDPNGADGLGHSVGTFVTDGAGALTQVPSDWADWMNPNPVSTNSAQTPTEWYINGSNGIYYTENGRVDIANVANNIIASNWAAPAPAAPVPGPSALLVAPLLAGAGFFGWRKRRQSA